MIEGVAKAICESHGGECQLPKCECWPLLEAEATAAINAVDKYRRQSKVKRRVDLDLGDRLLEKMEWVR